MNRWTWARSAGIGCWLKKLAIGVELVDMIAIYSELPEGSLATLHFKVVNPGVPKCSKRM